MTKDGTGREPLRTGPLLYGNYGHSYREVPLVDNADDNELKTIRVKSVLAQYDGLNLLDLTSPEWKAFVEAVAQKYNVETGRLCDGLIGEATNLFGSTSVDKIDLRAEKHNHRIYFRRDETEGELESCIASVYNAGITLRRALDDRANDLIAKYLS